MTSSEDLDRAIREKVASTNLTSVEKTLGLPEQVFVELIDEPSDWSFIVKLAVLLEAALSQLISRRLDHQRLQSHLDRLNVGGRTGKLQLALDLEIIEQFTAARLRAIAKLRNVFAHDLSVLSLTLPEYIDTLSPEARTRLVADLLTVPESTRSAGAPTLTGGEARHVFCVAGALALHAISQSYRNVAAESQWRQAKQIVGEGFFAKHSGDDARYRERLHAALELLEAMTH